jgi:hypothetical protein
MNVQYTCYCIVSAVLITIQFKLSSRKLSTSVGLVRKNVSLGAKGTRGAKKHGPLLLLE